MNKSNQDILTLAQKQPLLYNELEVLYETERIVPGSISYSIKRYKRLSQWSVDDMGLLEYDYNANDSENNMYIVSKSKPNATIAK